MQARIEAFLLLAVAYIFLVSAQTPNSGADQCQEVICPTGRACVRGEDGNSTVCVCPADCPREHAPVCSVFSTDHLSVCEMHKIACRHGYITAVRHKGTCNKGGAVQKHCPTEMLLDFHSRYLEWLFMAYKHTKLGRVLKKHARIDTVLDSDRKAIIMWEFENLDENKNDLIDDSELTSTLEQGEPCLFGFVEACNFDRQPGISRHEWAVCFPPRFQDLEDIAE